VLVVSYPVEIVAQKGGDSRQAAWITQGLGQAFGLAQAVVTPPELAQGLQCIAQLKPEIDSLRTCVSTLGEMLQGRQRLLQVYHCLAIGRARTRLDMRLAAIGQGLLPHLAPECMVREAFDVFAAPRGIERFQRLHDARVEAAPPLVREIPVGDLLSEGMLEGVLDVGKEASLIEELSDLQVSEAVPDLLLGLLSNGLQEGQGNISADDGRGLEQALCHN
jgi:hypothetical protein